MKLIHLYPVERLKQRCRIDCDCWLWTGSTGGNGVTPKLVYKGDDGKVKSTSVRRVMWEAVNGRPPKGKRVRATCENSMCVNPAHMKLATQGEINREIAAHEESRMRRRIATAKRGSAQAKLSEEKVREMRASSKPAPQLAAEMGVAVSTVYRVLSYRIWTERASPFAGLVR